VLPEDQLVVVTMPWLHFIHVREGEPTDDHLDISSLAREIYQIKKEISFGMTTSKPNDVKLRRAEHPCSRVHGAPNAIRARRRQCRGGHRYTQAGCASSFCCPPSLDADADRAFLTVSVALRKWDTASCFYASEP
jgi:hypothetical protein